MQDHVTDLVPEPVVDGLEVINIEQGECQRRTAVACPDDPIVEPGVQRAQVRQVGQGIGGGVPGQLLAGTCVLHRHRDQIGEVAQPGVGLDRRVA